jgi:RimJ/RimL family protein N-acetyltransferase
MTEMLQTARLILRQPNASDWPAFWDFFQSDRAKGVGGPLNLRDGWRHFAMELGHWDFFGHGMWTVTKRGSDTSLGMIGPWTPMDWPENEIGWMIFDPTVEGTGIATEAARAAVSHAYDVLGWDTAVSYVGAGNTRSEKLAQKLGAVLDANAPKPDHYPNAQVFRHPNPKAPQ